MKFFLLSVLFFIALCAAKTNEKQTYLAERARSHENVTNMVPFDEDVNVFLIPHTHDDPGWLVTSDQYYVKQVRYILDSVVAALQANKKRKFTYVEQSFFQRWWNEQNDKQKEIVRQLVHEGRLEMNLGGWCMTDEAGAHYEDIINEMTLGHKFIFDQLGIRPTVAWHIDPFGHSSQVMSLYASMGFDTFTLDRIHYDDMAYRKNNQKMEFVERGSKSLGEESDIFVHVLDNGYAAPAECNFFATDAGQCYYWTKDEDWAQWDNELPTYENNMEYHAKRFVEMVRKRATWYDNGNNILMTYGEDFTFHNAFIPFANMDKFMDYINDRYDQYHIKFQYAVLSDYVKAVNTHKKEWDVKKDDFFPYANKPSGFWTGYYTSRDRLKGLIREKMNELSNAEMYLALSKAEKKSLNFAELYSDIMTLRKAQGEAQHHDAITGTEKQAVANDYNVQLVNGAYYANKAASTVLDVYTTLENINKNSTEVFPSLTEENRIAVVLSNSIAWNRNEVIQLISPRSDIGIYDKEGKPFEVQINEIPEFSYDRRNGTYYVYFPVEIPAMGYTTVYIKVNKDAIVTKPIEDTFIGNNKMKLNTENGYIKEVTLSTGESLPLNANYYEYSGNNGAPQNSGAYAFVPSYNHNMNIGSTDDNKIIKTLSVSRKEGRNLGYFLQVISSENYNDVLQNTISEVNEDTIKFMTQRFDKKEGWGQRPSINSISIDLDEKVENTIRQQIVIKKSDSITQTVTIEFPYALPENTKVYMFTSIISHNEDVYTCVIKEICNKYAIVMISTTNEEGWKNDITLNYLAFTEGSQPFDSLHIEYGSIEGKTGDNGIAVMDAKIDTNDINTFIITQITSTTELLGTSIRHFSDKKYSINACTPSLTKDVPLIMSYIVISTKVIGEYVIPETSSVNIKVIKGNLVEEIQQTYIDGYSTIYRVYKEGIQEDAVEIITELNGLHDGKELVLQFNTNLHNEKTLYADTIGMEQQKRVYNPEFTQPISGNFYPVVSRVYIEDEKEDSRLTVLVDRAHGVSSQQEGRMEIMIKRKTLGDDGYGVGEALTENDQVKGRMWMIFGKKEISSLIYKQLDLYLAHPILPFYSSINNEQVESINNQYSFIQSELPKNIQLLNFQLAGLDDKTYILRFHHIYEKNESELAIPVEIDLSKLFKGFEIVDYEEMILTGMFNKEQVEKERLHWDTNEHETIDSSSISNTQKSIIRGSKSTIITLKPMEFKTFTVHTA